MDAIYHIWGTEDKEASEDDFSKWEVFTHEGVYEFEDAMHMLKQFIDIDKYSKLHYKYIIVETHTVGYGES